MRVFCSGLIFLLAGVLTACDASNGSAGEEYYEATVPGTFTQTVDHGNGRSCGATFAGQLYATVRLKRGESSVTGRANIVITGTAISVTGDTLYCRLSSTPAITSSWGTTEVTGAANNLHLADAHSETTAQSTSDETLSFNGAMAGNVLNGTVVFSRTTRNTVVDCQPDGRGGQTCNPPRTVTVKTAWTLPLSLPRS